jgi:hypothetical protein
MAVRDKPVETDPPLFVADPRRSRTGVSLRRSLQFRLRTMFVVVLLVCGVLSVIYYDLFKKSPAGPIIRLRRDGSVSIDGKAELPLSGAPLSEALTEASQRYWALDDKSRRMTDTLSGDWDQMPGPRVTLVVDPQAAHGAMDTLLRACVDHGFYSYVLKDASDRKRMFSFTLFKAVQLEGLPDIDGLPPLPVRLTAAEDGSLSGLYVIRQRCRDFAELRESLVTIAGDKRGPHSIRATAEVHLLCDRNLRLRHVIDALDAVTSQVTKDGKRVTLMERVRPVSWGQHPYVREVEHEFWDIGK